MADCTLCHLLQDDFVNKWMNEWTNKWTGNIDSRNTKLLSRTHLMDSRQLVSSTVIIYKYLTTKFWDWPVRIKYLKGSFTNAMVNQLWKHINMQCLDEISQKFSLLSWPNLFLYNSTNSKKKRSCDPVLTMQWKQQASVSHYTLSCMIN